MIKREKKDLILSAGESVKNGVLTTEIENKDVAAMMKEIAANALFIGLYKFNTIVISNIGDGNFETIKSKWSEAIHYLNGCLAIIGNEGENLKDILTTEEIDEAINYTIFEQTGKSENDE